MERTRVVIIEDEFVIAEDIRILLDDAGYDILAVFDKAENVFPFVEKERPDILLVDINLVGQMDGIELVKLVKTKLDFPFVYITANSDQLTFDRAKITKPNAFLIKPFTPANLLASVELALFNFSTSTNPDRIERVQSPERPEDIIINRSLFIRDNGRYTKIHCDEILFAEAAGSYVHIQTVNHRFTLSQNLSQFQRKMQFSSLVRIHRSYLINVSRVDSFEESSVIIQNHKLPISDNHKAEFLSKIHCL